MTDKALEAARAVYDDRTKPTFRSLEAAISTHLDALTGEVEVVGYLNWSEIHQRRYFDDSPRGQRDAWPLVTLAALQAMQARAEAAEARVKELEEALRGMVAIVDDSAGVAGYHKNGNIAEWDEFEEVEIARTALKAGSNG